MDISQIHDDFRNKAEFIVEVLLHADDNSDKATAEKYNISTRTICNYRARLKDSPDIASLYFDAKKRIFSNMVGKLARAQEKLLDHLTSVALQETDLGKLANAMRIISDSFLAQAIMTGEGSKPDVKRDNQGTSTERARQALRAASEGQGTLRTISPTKLPQ